MSDDPSTPSYYLLGELVGPAAGLARRYVLVLPLAVAVGGAVAGWTFAPAIPQGGPPGWLGSFFGTAAQVAATLFVALALEARYVAMERMTAGLTVGYVALTLAAAVAGTSAELPSALYRPLLAVTVGGGLGGLLAVALISYSAIAAQISEEQDRRKAEIYGTGGPRQ